jgi:uncharacterized protein (DUF58 family)
MPARTPAEILARVERIEILARGSVSETFSGEYHSSFRGQGLEFAEVREYQSGDNYRDIDWNVSARLGFPYIKKYQETRELNVFFIVDVSASQSFGTAIALKQERVAEIIALLSFSALSNNDKVGADHVFRPTGEVSASAQRPKQGAGDPPGRPLPGAETYGYRSG